MTTTADTDDTNPRLAALEADVRNINVQLERVNTELQESRREQQESRREQQAENRAMRAEFQAEIRAVNARIDQTSAEFQAELRQTNAKIDELGAQVNAKIDQVSAQTNAKIDQKIERLTYFLLGGMVTLLARFALLYFRTAADTAAVPAPLSRRSRAAAAEAGTQGWGRMLYSTCQPSQRQEHP